MVRSVAWVWTPVLNRIWWVSVANLLSSGFSAAVPAGPCLVPGAPGTPCSVQRLQVVNAVHSTRSWGVLLRERLSSCGCKIVEEFRVRGKSHVAVIVRMCNGRRTISGLNHEGREQASRTESREHGAEECAGFGRSVSRYCRHVSGVPAGTVHMHVPLVLLHRCRQVVSMCDSLAAGTSWAKLLALRSCLSGVPPSDGGRWRAAGQKSRCPASRWCESSRRQSAHGRGARSRGWGGRRKIACPAGQHGLHAVRAASRRQLPMHAAHVGCPRPHC